MGRYLWRKRMWERLQVTDFQGIISALGAHADLATRNASPLYIRVQHAIRAIVEEGLVGVDEALPAERDLAAALGVSRVTVRKAVAGLVEHGLLSQRRGAGTFVSPRVDQPLKKLTGFSQDIEARGMKAGVTWLDRSIGAADPEEAKALGCKPGYSIARLYRIRFADDKPMCLEHATLPQEFLANPTAVETSLYAVLQANGTRPIRAVQSLRAQLFNIEQARLLHVQTGTACLYMERRSFLPSGRAVEFVRSYYRGDAYNFVAELEV